MTAAERPAVSTLGVQSALSIAAFPRRAAMGQSTDSPTSRAGGSVHSVPSPPQDVQSSFRAVAGPPRAHLWP